MARGWESKAVEAQQEAASQPRVQADTPLDEDPAIRTTRATLMLARTKALTDLQHACAPAHRNMLEQTIAEIDRQLARIVGGR